MPEAIPPRWQPISAIERRVLGVLVEKAKTTPDAYPMTLNAICRRLQPEEQPLSADEPRRPTTSRQALDELRALGARDRGARRAAASPSTGTTAYEWLGVDKTELAVMTELLLARRANARRAARPGRPHGADRRRGRPAAGAGSLKAKGLLISLTSAGRGQVVTHALYEPREMEKLRAEFGAGSPAAAAADEGVAPPPRADELRLLTLPACHKRPRPSPCIARRSGVIAQRAGRAPQRAGRPRLALRFPLCRAGAAQDCSSASK